MSIEAIVNELSAIAANPHGQLKAYKAEGKKCIGVMPYYAPEELVYAAGMVPFGDLDGYRKFKVDQPEWQLGQCRKYLCGRHR